MDADIYDDDPSFLGLHEDTVVLDVEPEEVALVPDAVRPSTTSELKGMLQQAGTELTVKYLT
ncbi:unnamed protein product, partial [Candidula unifasciata]